MKKIFLTFIIAVMAISAALGQTVTKDYKFGNITGLDASYAYDVRVTQGNSNKIKVICPEYLEEYMDITSFNNILYLKMNIPRNFRYTRNTNNKIIVEMEMKTINYINLSGASSVSAQGVFQTDNLSYDLSGAASVKGINISGRYVNIDCSGASNLSQNGSFGKMDIDCSGASKVNHKGNINEISGEISGATQFSYTGNSSSINMEASGASKAALAGRSKSVELSCSGASYINAKEMISENASTVASGASKINVYASEILKADATASSVVNYYGNPKQIISRPKNIRKAD